MPRAARSPTPVVWTTVRSRGSPLASKRRSSAARTASATPKPELPSTITVCPLWISPAAASASRTRGVRMAPRYPALAIWRAMISRWIWLVPS